MLSSMRYESPLGVLTLASDGEALLGLWMQGQKYFGGTVAKSLGADRELPVFAAAAEWLDAYFAGGRPAIADLPLAPRGSAFRRNVWDILCKVPYGEVVTYGQIASAVAAGQGLASMSAQAVGGAVGHNPISIIIPCHRVVGSGGSLTGYAGGIERKIRLLELEGVQMSLFSTPEKGTAL